VDRASKFLTDVTGRYAGAYSAAVHDLYASTVLRNAPQAADARKALAEAMRNTMGAAEVLGAMMMLQAASRGVQFAADQPILPRVTLTEALEDLVTRAPKTLKNAAQRTAQRIAELYTSDRVMAFVRSAEETVTTEAQTMIARAFRDGLGETDAGKQIAFGVNRIACLLEAGVPQQRQHWRHRWAIPTGTGPGHQGDTASVPVRLNRRRRHARQP
jgi:hypothetical protein